MVAYSVSPCVGEAEADNGAKQNKSLKPTRTGHSVEDGNIRVNSTERSENACE